MGLRPHSRGAVPAAGGVAGPGVAGSPLAWGRAASCLGAANLNACKHS